MIYNFTINISDKKSQPVLKQFYLTADNDTVFYRRCLEQYRTQKDQITIVDRIPDAHIDPNMKPEKRIGYKPPKVGVDKPPVPIDDVADDVVNELIAKARGLGVDDVEAKKADWLVVETQTPANDIKTALSIYNKVKVYYKRTGAKKNKVYIILCKDKKKESSGKRSSSNSSRSSKAGKKKKAK